MLPAAICLLSLHSYAQVSNTSRIIIKPVVENVFSPASFKFSGYLGDKLEAVIQNNIKAADVEALVDVFRHRNETSLWQTEFWGKWMLSAAKAYQYSKDAALFAVMKKSSDEIMATQSADGYIGNYAPGKHLGNWDIWGRKYVLLGLIYYYDITGDTSVIRSAKRLLDFTLTQVGPGKTNIVKTGAFRGMPSSSILEPVVLLYQRTGEQRYLVFAKYIVAQWETPEGPQLISKALAGVPVSQRFGNTLTNWWSWENSRKAYEMMSCYDGLLKLYQVTGDKNYLTATIAAVKNIKQDEINIVGSGAAFECWYGGAQKQVYPTQHTMETCVTITWMKLCYELYRLTGDITLVENIETSAYNNLLGSLQPDGSRFSKYSGLQGYRDVDEFQCRMKINCCMANGPRGLMLLQDLAVMQQQNNVYINMYNAGDAAVTLRDNNIMRLQCETVYPEDGDITIHVNPTNAVSTNIFLRIPSWSSNTTVDINGVAVTETFTPGTYLQLTREWKMGDVIHIKFDMRGRMITVKNGYEQYKAIVRGPIVLARDSRFGNYNMGAELTNDGKVSAYVQLEPIKLPGAWMAFNYSFTTGTGENPVTLEVPLIDFSSAGNTWKAANRYRVWVPVSLDVMKER